MRGGAPLLGMLVSHGSRGLPRLLGWHPERRSYIVFFLGFFLVLSRFLWFGDRFILKSSLFKLLGELLFLFVRLVTIAEVYEGENHYHY